MGRPDAFRHPRSRARISSSVWQCLAHERQLSDVFRPACGLLRSDHIGQRCDGDDEIGAQAEADRVAPQVIEAASSGRLEHDIELTCLGDERPVIFRREHVGLTSERDALWRLGGAQPGVKLGERLGEAGHVCAIAGRSDIQVAGDQGHTVGKRRLGADDDEADLVLDQSAKHPGRT